MMLLPQGQDRRRVQRRPGDTIESIQVLIDRAEQPWPAKILDLSIEGAGLLIDREVSVGAKFAIQTRGGKSLTDLTSEVRHCRKLPDGGWSLGCRFSRNLLVDDLMALG